ncbi:FAD-dependent monooxygenase [Massilia pseudoviolaceinigra]|uniref:FAD-dependent monooxygenase n=1 Tax=Massilia pseudoviolaceinigra TaxID=3057165 RepID=UPI002796C8FA|nr:FAD-dependent monooxygenase [Massilia sp. CCM 9206]MDQ1924360.1 FAD-dependent monooxygenase [Massilia sp. CCM 9206]
MTSPNSSSARHQSAVCIVGNGAIAKTAALGFAQAGHSVTVLVPPSVSSTPAATAGEQPWDVRVYALNHTAHGLLSSLKVWGALDMDRVAAVDTMAVNGDGARPGDLAFDAFGAHVGALAWIVEDRNLNQALDAALRFAANVTIVKGRAVSLALEADGATVRLDDGSAIASALVVGADGGQSWVRGQCDIGVDYRAYHQRAVVANFSCEKPHHGVAHQWFTGEEGIVALLPLPGKRVSLVWSAPDALADTLMNESLGELAVRLAVLAGDKLGELKPLRPEAVKDLPLALIRPHAIVAPRVALVGDAAHVVHPLAGHGMNLGFADVAGLLKTIAAREPQRAIGDERVLARYARARKEDILLMQVATDGLARLFGTNLEPVRIARNLGLNLLDKLPVLKRRLMSHAMGK